MEEDRKDRTEEAFEEEEVEVVHEGPEQREAREEEAPSAEAAREEMKEKYLRLYAEFENYRKRVAKDREELLRYGNESLLADLLPSLDNLEIALEHAAAGETAGALVEGVENTLRELYRTLEKYGVKRIEALDRPFDPAYHHAISQEEREDVEPGIVVEELRKGFIYGDKVLRAPLVSVSKRPEGSAS
ncbi:MAG: nucleotide exchange factor GrpE [Nitrospirota bacterium]